MDVRDWIHKAPGFMFQQALTFILPLSSCSTYVTAFPTTGLEIERSWRGGVAGMGRRRGFLGILHVGVRGGRAVSFPTQ